MYINDIVYINDVHILFYILFGIIGAIIGQFLEWANFRLSDHKTVFSKEIFTEYKKNIKFNYKLMLVMAIIYMALLFLYGINKNFINNINLLKFMVLSPMLVSAFIIDYKIQIIPNRLNLTIFETGLIFTFMAGISNINLAKDSLIGMLIGGGVFLLITLIGGLIAGKEAMGFGDVKFMGALGLYFGILGIILVTLVAFLVGAILSIILLATKIKKTSEYIPFGPFIVIACFSVIFIPTWIIIFALIKFFTLGMAKI